MNNDAPQRTGFRSVFCYLALTFTATFALEGWFIASGVNFQDDVMRSTPALWLMAVMWIPGISALIVTKFVEGAPLKKALSLRIGSLGPYLLVMILAPMAFAAMYGLSWLAGLTAPDPELSTLTAATASEPLTADTVFQVLLPMSIMIGPFLNFTFGLGEELGWRGFLLPRLMVLGKGKAYALLGVLWGLWHAPLIWAGFNYPGYPLTGIIMMILLCYGFGLLLNEMTLHYRSVLLAAFIHGAVNAQGYGVWPWLFPGTDPMLGGGTGITGVAVWLLAGGTALWITGKMKG